MGVGGTCDSSFGGSYDPPFGYYCSTSPPRGKQYIHNPPVAVTSGFDLLPHAPYSNISGAVVHAWMPEHWYSNSYEVGSQSVSTDGTSVTFNFTRGGFQGSIGQGGAGGEWYFENEIEELDAPGEWFYDGGAAKLYYVVNSTTDAPPDDSVVFEAVMTKVLLNYTGTQANPITNVSVRGVTIRDAAFVAPSLSVDGSVSGRRNRACGTRNVLSSFSIPVCSHLYTYTVMFTLTYTFTDAYGSRYTYLDPHGAPAGGDWGLQRSGAVTLAGTVGGVIDSCLFTRVDGLGVFISGFNRRLTISNSTFEWIGTSNYDY